ncbi:MAG: proteasome accessory factor PafA2 family protein, partial [Actinomycetaceae bacterium UMB1218B]|nr:proteasome accessory factor PafA2 family protein [Actinomycetaceae bacterium UMB1218B]
EDLTMADPMRSIREISIDLTGRTEVELADGRRWTPVQIQREIRERILGTIDAAELDDTHRYVLDLWERGLNAIESGDWSPVDTELDIAIKAKLFSSYVSKAGTNLADPRVARLDLSYHDITGSSLLDRMEASGLVKRLTKRESVQAAVNTPPATTRAHLRGRIIGAAEDARVDLSADWVHVRVDDLSSSPLSLQDPLANEDPRVDELIGKITSCSPVLPA